MHNDKPANAIRPKLTKGFKVSVCKMYASNSTTFHVVVDHPDRPTDAMPWDEGRMEVFASAVQEHAELTKDDWVNFFDNRAMSRYNEFGS